MKKRERQLRNALASLPQIDLEAARQALHEESDGAGLPVGWQWIVAAHDALAMMEDYQRRAFRLECSLLSFVEFFRRGDRFPGSGIKQKKKHKSTSIMGRPPAKVDSEQAVKLLTDGKRSIAEVAKVLGVHRNTLYRRRQVSEALAAAFAARASQDGGQ